MMWAIGKNKGFTFIELMVSMVILCAGLVLIIQGLVLAASALNRAQNMVKANAFIEAKMQELETLEKLDSAVKKGFSEGDFSSLERVFNWSLDISALKNAEDDKLREDLNVVTLKVAWQEQNQPRGFDIMTYLKNKKEDAQ